MKGSFDITRLLAPVAAGFLVIVMLLGIRAVQISGDVEKGVALQNEAFAQLLPLLEASRRMDAICEDLGVGGAMAEEVRQRLSTAFPEVVLADPIVVRAWRLHKAVLSFEGKDSRTALDRLGEIAGLPVRMIRLDIGVTEAGLLRGEVELGWLERLP